jgi:MFS family permease
MGVAGDFVGRINALTVCMVGCCITSLTIWVNAKGEAATWIYAILYGCFGGGYLTLTPACLPQIVGYDYTVPANGILFSLNVFGYLFGAPITSALINHSSPPNYMYAGLYVGIVYAIAAALCITLRVLKAGWNPLIKV